MTTHAPTPRTPHSTLSLVRSAARGRLDLDRPCPHVESASDDVFDCLHCDACAALAAHVEAHAVREATRQLNRRRARHLSARRLRRLAARPNGRYQLHDVSSEFAMTECVLAFSASGDELPHVVECADWCVEQAARIWPLPTPLIAGALADVPEREPDADPRPLACQYVATAHGPRAPSRALVAA